MHALTNVPVSAAAADPRGTRPGWWFATARSCRWACACADLAIPCRPSRAAAPSWSHCRRCSATPRCSVANNAAVASTPLPTTTSCHSRCAIMLRVCCGWAWWRTRIHTGLLKSQHKRVRTYTRPSTSRHQTHTIIVCVFNYWNEYNTCYCIWNSRQQYLTNNR